MFKKVKGENLTKSETNYNNFLRLRGNMQNKMGIKKMVGGMHQPTQHEETIIVPGPHPVPGEPGVERIESQHHTLFIETNEEETHEMGLGMVQRVPAHKKFTLYIDEFGELEKGLHKILHKLRKAEQQDWLNVRIHSGGGYVTELQTLENVFKEAFFGRVMTHLDAFGYSCGGFIFLMGDKRVCYESSELMLHAASYASWGDQNTVKSHVDFVHKQLESYSRRLLKPYMTPEEIDAMLKGQDYWFSAKDLCEKGMATEVIVDGIELEADEYLELYDYEENGGEREKFFDMLNERAKKRQEQEEKEAEAEAKLEEEVRKRVEEELKKEKEAKKTTRKTTRKTTTKSKAKTKTKAKPTTKE